MTVTAADIPTVSPYEVDENVFTTALFTALSAQAKAVMDEVSPDGMPTVMYDRCHALIICHFYALKLGEIEMRSKETGDVVWVQPGQTGYWIQAFDLMKQFETVAFEELDSTMDGVTRADGASTAFRLDQSEPLNYFDESEA